MLVNHFHLLLLLAAQEELLLCGVSYIVCPHD